MLFRSHTLHTPASLSPSVSPFLVDFQSLCLEIRTSLCLASSFALSLSLCLFSFLSLFSFRASPVVQWLGVCLPMQGTRVRALVWEDPTCCGATGPVSHGLLSLRVWSLCSATREAATVRGPRTAMRSGPHLPQLGEALARKRRPNTAINK